MLSTVAAADTRLSFSRFIESVSTNVPLVGRARRVDRLPDGRTLLVLRVMSGERADVCLLGPRTHALLKDAKGFERAVSIAFKPGWIAPLLGVNASDLVDRYVYLDDIWGSAARDLGSDLVAATSTPDLIDRVGRAFARRVARTVEPASARLARRAAHMLETEDARIDDVADRLGITSRHLRRAFVENIGVGPKDFARAVRLQRAVRLAGNSPDWARVAIDAGYYDQSHLIADFRDLVGMSPGAFLERTREKNPLAS